MIKPLLYLSTFALGGALALAAPAVAGEVVDVDPPYERAVTIEDGTLAEWDAGRSCWVMAEPRDAIEDNPEPDEPNPRFDAAKECLGAGSSPSIAANPDEASDIPEDRSELPGTRY